MKRNYTIGINAETGRETLTIHASLKDIPFNVFRDIGRLAGLSYDNDPNRLVFEFLSPDKMNKAKKILHGAMFVEHRPCEF